MIRTIAFSFIFLSLTAKSSEIELSLKPNSLFTFEDKGVVFTAKVSQSDGKAQKIGLIQVDEQGRKLKYIGAMYDQGVFSDRVSGDGIYTRKVQFKPKKAGRLYFEAINEEFAHQQQDPQDASSALAEFPARRTALQIVRRPTFIESIKQAWASLTR